MSGQSASSAGNPINSADIENSSQIRKGGAQPIEPKGELRAETRKTRQQFSNREVIRYDSPALDPDGMTLFLDGSGVPVPNGDGELKKVSDTEYASGQFTIVKTGESEWTITRGLPGSDLPSPLKVKYVVTVSPDHATMSVIWFKDDGDGGWEKQNGRKYPTLGGSVASIPDDIVLKKSIGDRP